MTQTIRIGTRGSPLALVQAGFVKAALCDMHGYPDDAVEIVPIQTTGDRVQDRPLAEIGGKALWTKELDIALNDGRVDCAVHSMKDVETIRPADIVIAATLPRADARDRLIGAEGIAALPEAACIGTSSPRRAAQLLNLRPDINIQPLRGNVATRMDAVNSGKISATILAAAGLDRLGHYDVGATLDISTLLPAPQQGAIGVEVMEHRGDLRDVFAALSDDHTRCCINTERAFLYALGADCHSPVAAHARIENGAVKLEAQLFTNDGRDTIADNATTPLDRAETAAGDLARGMLERASPRIRALFTV